MDSGSSHETNPVYNTYYVELVKALAKAHVMGQAAEVESTINKLYKHILVTHEYAKRQKGAINCTNCLKFIKQKPDGTFRGFTREGTCQTLADMLGQETASIKDAENFCCSQYFSETTL